MRAFLMEKMNRNIDRIKLWNSLLSLVKSDSSRFKIKYYSGNFILEEKYLTMFGWIWRQSIKSQQEK